MAMRASGTFIVTITPLPAEENVGDPSIGRMSLHKEFQGELEATAHGQMLATMTPVEGSAAYAALDRVTGSLRGRNGSFSLQHRGVMNRGAPELSIWVVPDSCAHHAPCSWSMLNFCAPAAISNRICSSSFTPSLPPRLLFPFQWRRG